MVINTEIYKQYPALYAKINAFAERIEDEGLRATFVQCSLNTLATTVRTDGSDVYLITGDIDAMWLRDSSAQVLQYLEIAPETEDVKRLISGLLKRQMRCIIADPYANAFNFKPDGNGHSEDECDEKNPLVFERKFELDSLCYPIFLASRYYDYTGDDEVFDEEFFTAAERIVGVFETEQDHHGRSHYFHYRPTETPEFSVPNGGKGGPCAVNGLIWSGYRPSDDPCIYGYFIPGNIFASVAMHSLGGIAASRGKSRLAARALALSVTVEEAVKKYGIIEHEKYGRMYAYETDGLGNYNLMDDANVPSLLGLPYLGWCAVDDEIYLNTRRFALSDDNPYFFRGNSITGIGSPHTLPRYVWPISLMMEGLTTDNGGRINEIVQLLCGTTDGTGYMHESIFADDPSVYTRPWFAWANSLFAYFIIKKADKIACIKKTTEGGTK